MELRRLTLTLIAVVILLGLPASSLQAQQASKTNKITPPTQWFEPNQGQSDPQFSFIAHDRGYTLFLGSHEVAYSLVQIPKDDEAKAKGHLTFVNVRMELLGANVHPTLEGIEPLSGISNYFNGSSAVTNVPHYAAVQYRNLYPGIDMIYHGNRGQFSMISRLLPGLTLGRFVYIFPRSNAWKLAPMAIW